MDILRIALCVLSTALVTGCSTLPTCGTPEAAGSSCSAPWYSVLGGIQPQGRDYVANPYTLPAAPATVQPNFQPFGATNGSGYHTVRVVLPDGKVSYLQCKELEGKNVGCF